MNPGFPTKLTCPHCGAHKYIQSLLTGNTFDATLWSDNKADYPMLPQPSEIQKCTKCGKFYFYIDSIPKENIFQWIWRQLERFYINFIDTGDYEPKALKEAKALSKQNWEESYVNGFGNLSFEETNAAYTQLYSEHLSKRRKESLYVEWFFAFNDEYNGRKRYSDWSEIPIEIIERHNAIVADIIKHIKSPIFIAELYRESGQFDKCIEMIGDMSLLPKSDVSYAEQILKHAQVEDRRVFRIHRHTDI